MYNFQINTLSKFEGVSWDYSKNMWKAYYVNRKKELINIGYFCDDEIAAIAVNHRIYAEGLDKERIVNKIYKNRVLPIEISKYYEEPIIQLDDTLKNTRIFVNFITKIYEDNGWLNKLN